MGNVKRLLHYIHCEPISWPVLGENVVLALKLVLQSSVSIEPDKEPDIAKVVMEEWGNDQHSIFHRAG